MTKYITSKMSTSVNYAVYAKGPNGINEVKQIITINGGADVIDVKTLVTPEGVVTAVSDSDFVKLQDNPIFNRHLERGVIKVSTNERIAQKTPQSMTKDNSAQMTPRDYKKQGKRKPKTAKGEE